MILSGIYIEYGNFNEALAATQKSIDLNPDNYTYHIAWCHSYDAWQSWSRP